MIIIGLDGADYYISKEYFDVDRLYIDLEPTHTATMWTSYLSGVMPEEHGIISWRPVIGSPANLDFIWNHGNWTVFATPVCMPPVCINCKASDYHLKAEEEAWETELREFEEAYENHTTDHFVGVIRCLDVASHTREKEYVLAWYKKVFDIIKETDFDLLLSDHGFKLFNQRGGEKDHSKDGLIKGMKVKKASEVVKYMKNLIEGGKLNNPTDGARGILANLV